MLVIATPKVAPAKAADLAQEVIVAARLSARRLLRSPSNARECAAAALTKAHAQEDRAALTDHLTLNRATAAGPTSASEESGAQDLATERDHGAARRDLTAVAQRVLATRRDLALARDRALARDPAQERDPAAEGPERL